MPRKKIKKTFKKKSLPSKKVVAKTKPGRNPFRFAESYTSLLMGIVGIIIAVLFVVSVVKQSHHIQDTSSTSTTATSAPSKTFGRTYVVQENDDLWHIAEKFYKSGYNYVDIIEANNIDDPSTIYAGIKLIIPDVMPKEATIDTTHIVQTQASITGSSYTVKAGDTLWDIAVRAYGDGYRWVDIAKVNKLENPGLIFSGNTLSIPR